MYLGFIVIDIFFLDVEFDKRIGKVVIIFVCFIVCVWFNFMFIEKIKMVVYNVCVISILLYGGEIWMIYVR